MTRLRQVASPGLTRDDWNALIGAIAFAIALTLASVAFADAAKPSAMFCYLARAHRAVYATDKAAEEAARAQGASQATIDKAKRCAR